MRYRRIDFGAIRHWRVRKRGYYSIDILGVARATQAKFRAVSLRHLLHVIDQPRRWPDGDHQYATGQRIQRAGMPDFRRANQPLNLIDRPARSFAARLIDIE